MNKLILIGAVALFSLPASAALAVPMCDGPNFEARDANGVPIYSEMDEAQKAERVLHSEGIDASMTRFWNGCIQTFVNENGHTVMKFYDPNSYAEVPVN